MPRSPRAWASWNYRVVAEGTNRTQTIYWMNSLQGVSQRTQYFVSVNGEEQIAPDQILRRIPYEHPLFSLGTLQAQPELPGLNLRSPDQSVYFAGSYFRYGFHEDAFRSALECARAVTGQELWT